MFPFKFWFLCIWSLRSEFRKSTNKCISNLLITIHFSVLLFFFPFEVFLEKHVAVGCVKNKDFFFQIWFNRYIKFICFPYNCSETNLGDLRRDSKVIITTVINHLSTIQVVVSATFHSSLCALPHLHPLFIRWGRWHREGGVSGLSRAKQLGRSGAGLPGWGSVPNYRFALSYPLTVCHESGSGTI